MTAADLSTREASRPAAPGPASQSGRLRWVAGWPLSPAFVVIPAVLIVVADLALLQSAFGWRYGVWWYASAAWHENLTVVGPIAATGATAYAGMLYRGPRNLFLLGHVGRHARRRLLRHLLVILGWDTAAHVAGVLPLTIWTALNADGGQLGLMSVLRGLIALWACVVLGYMVGVLARSPAWAPVTGVAVFTWTALPVMGGGQFSLVSPVQSWSLGNWSRLAPWPLLYTLVFFLALTLTCVHLSLLRVSNQRAGFATVAAGATVIGLVAVGLSWRPMTVVPTTPDVACVDVSAGGRRIPVCLAQADQQLLPDVAHVVQQAVAAGAGPLFDRVTDSNAVLPVGNVAAVPVSPKVTSQDMMSGLVRSAATGPACMSGDETLAAARGRQIQQAIVERLTAQAATPEQPVAIPATVSPTFDVYPVWRLERTQFEALIRRHAAAVKSCALTTVPS